MRDAIRGRVPAVLFFAFCWMCSFSGARAAEEHDRYEEQAVARTAERAYRVATGDRARWIAALEAAFPGKVVHATRSEEYDTWFTLLAGRDGAWHRADSAPEIAVLFDRVAERRELGPVPSITRYEFSRYTRQIRRDSSSRDVPNPGADADRVFRALDRNANGALAPSEFTTGLKNDPFRFDADGNGRITAEEYRGYFTERVEVRTGSLASGAQSGKSAPARGTNGELAEGLPEWFGVLDTDADGQVALFEWRRDGRPLAEFAEMDLDDDGLLPPDEYRRFLTRAANELKQRKLEEAWGQ